LSRPPSFDRWSTDRFSGVAAFRGRILLLNLRQKPRSLVRPGLWHQQRIGRVRETCGHVVLRCMSRREVWASTCNETSYNRSLMNGTLVDLYRCPASFVTYPPTLSCLVRVLPDRVILSVGSFRSICRFTILSVRSRGTICKYRQRTSSRKFVLSSSRTFFLTEAKH
jgi:hypothetical protein